MSGVVISAFEAMTPVPVGGIFPNNAASAVPAGITGHSNAPPPVGSVLYPTSVIPGYAPAINQGSVPNPSNFGAVVFPVKIWNRNADYGDNLQIYQSNLRGAPGNSQR